MAIIGGDDDQLRWRQLAVGVTAAIVFVASVAVLTVRSSSDDEDSADEAVGSAMTTTTTPASSPTTATGTGDAGTAPGVDAPGSAPTPEGAPTRTGTGASASAPSPGPPGPPGWAPRLRVVSTRLDFGSDSTSQPLQLTNDGGGPLSWRASTSSPVLSVVPASGTLPPGASTQASVRLDRLAGPEGRLAGSVRITSDGGEGTVEVTGNVARPPAILWVMWDKSRVARSPCSTFPTAMVVSAAVADESGLSVVVRWRDPSGRTGSRGLSGGSDGVYRGELGPFTATGTVTWSVQATDALGAVSRSPEETAVVDACT